MPNLRELCAAWKDEKSLAAHQYQFPGRKEVAEWKRVVEMSVNNGAIAAGFFSPTCQRNAKGKKRGTIVCQSGSGVEFFALPMLFQYDRR